MRRWNGNSFGQKFLGNAETKVVHDLDNEQPDCQIEQIIADGMMSPTSSCLTPMATATLCVPTASAHGNGKRKSLCRIPVTTSRYSPTGNRR